MNALPEFIRSPVNRIAPASPFTADIEGYVFREQLQVVL